MAVKKLYPEVKFGIGPAIENGFYYDFDFSNVILNQQAKDLAKRDSSSPSAPQNDRISPDDLPKIEKEMQAIIKQNLDFIKKEISQTEAKKLFADQPYKIELIEELGEQKISTYQSGDFTDLCAGPHIESTKKINTKAFKLSKIAGAYWRGDEKNKMLTRVYGLAFATEKELADYLKMLEEAEKRDHRKLGANLDLFSFHSESPGMPFWHNNGLIIFNNLVEHWREIQKEHNYMEVKLPPVLNVSLWKQSGHYDHYKNDMFFTENDGVEMALRPMDCPGTILFYKERPHSYSELPIRIGELGTVYRNEKSGELHGLMRVQQITQDDAHIVIAENMIEKEVVEVLGILEKIYKPFSLKREFFLSTRPDDAMGDIETWRKAETALKNALDKSKIKYGLKEKDGAFYGPKIDVQMYDSLGRTWQSGTIQLDFFMPKNFGMEYIDKEGKKQRPVMIHRALMGSLERFIGILLEHYAGALPVWLSPIQTIILPIGQNHQEYGQEILGLLKQNNIRATLNLDNETIGKKIREAEMQKIPYLLVVGDKEVKAKSVAVRQRGAGDKGAMAIDKFIAKIREEVVNKK